MAISTGREFVIELHNRGLKLEKRRKDKFDKFVDDSYWYIYSYECTKENEAIINEIYANNEWKEPVFIRYAGGWGWIDCGTPYITVEFEGNGW